MYKDHKWKTKEYCSRVLDARLVLYRELQSQANVNPVLDNYALYTNSICICFQVSQRNQLCCTSQTVRPKFYHIKYVNADTR